jgi:hypothetical protein
MEPPYVGCYEVIYNPTFNCMTLVAARFRLTVPAAGHTFIYMKIAHAALCVFIGINHSEAGTSCGQ